MDKNLLKAIRNFLNRFKKQKEITTALPACIDEKDERNLGSDALFIPTKKDVPTESFIVYHPTWKDQFDSDMCVGFGGGLIREATELIVLAGEFLFAMCKKLSGTINGYGTSILQMCKAAVKYGIPPQEMWQMTGNGQRNKLADWNNIPDKVYKEAEKHKAGAYFEVVRGNGLDWHDTFKAYLWHFRKSKLLIATGTDAHFTTLIGWDKDTDEIISQDTYKRSSMNYRIGRYDPASGWRHWKRYESAQLFTAYIITDLTRDLAELLNAYKGQAVKGTGDKCYLIKDGKKCWIESEAVAAAYNISPWDDVLTIVDEELDLIPEGEKLDITQGQFYKVLNFVVNSPHLFNKAS